MNFGKWLLYREDSSRLETLVVGFNIHDLSSGSEEQAKLGKVREQAKKGKFPLNIGIKLLLQ